MCSRKHGKSEKAEIIEVKREKKKEQIVKTEEVRKVIKKLLSENDKKEE